MYNDNSMNDWIFNDPVEDDISNFSLDSFADYREDEELEEAPTPTELRISTITATGKLVSYNDKGEDVTTDEFLPLSLEELYKEIEIDEKNGPFISIEYAENPVRGFDKRAKKKRKQRKLKLKRKQKERNFIINLLY